MLLNFANTKVICEVEEESSFVSKHSGKLLQHLRLRTVMRGEEQNEEFLTALRESPKSGLTSIDQDNNVLKHWKIANTSYRYTNGSFIYNHSVEIEETELLQVSSLTLEDLIVQPYKYAELFNGDTLKIEAKVVLSKEEHVLLKTIFRAGDEIQVVRRGIDERPRSMKLTMGYWSEHEDQIKHEISLIDVEEKPQPSSDIRPFRVFGSATWQTAENQAVLDALLAALIDKGVFTSEEIGKIREDAANNGWENRYAFLKAEDIGDE